jgi:cytidylate kinase
VSIVTLARQLGSGGDAIAREVAQTLGLRLVDRHVIGQAAVKAGVPRVALEELEYEGRRGLVERMLSVVYTMPAIPTMLEPVSGEAPATLVLFGGLLSPLHRPMSLSMQAYAQIVDMVIHDLARGGDVIVVGRGGQVVLKDVSGVLHVQIVASFEQRLANLMAREGIDRREASTRLRASDRARADYLRRYHGIDNSRDTALYDLTINTDNLPLPVAVAAIVGACQALDAQDNRAGQPEEEGNESRAPVDRVG